MGLLQVEGVVYSWCWVLWYECSLHHTQGHIETDNPGLFQVRLFSQDHRSKGEYSLPEQ